MTEDTPFRPCPICGHELTIKDIVCIDDYGEPIEEMRDLDSVEEYKDFVEEYEEFVGSTHMMTVDCHCGYSFGYYPQSDDLCDGTWFDKFVALANTRAEDISDKGKAVIMNHDNPYGRVLSKFYEELHEERPSLTMVDVVRAGLIYWQKEIKEWSE